MSRRAAWVALLLVSWAAPASAGFVIGSGRWECATRDGMSRGGTLVECLANVLVAQLAARAEHGRWAPPDALFEGDLDQPLRRLTPARHAHARAFVQAATDGAEMPRLRTVLRAIQRTPAALSADPQTQHRLKHLRAAWIAGEPDAGMRGAGGSLVVCRLAGAEGPIEGWGPSPVQCFADLLLLACPVDALDAERCAAETPLREMAFDAAGSAGFSERMTAWAGAAIARDVEPPPAPKPTVWLMPEPAQVRDRARVRAAALRGALPGPG